MECIELAIQAPTASNQQGWRWVVVDDPQTKVGLAEIYRQNWEAYSKIPLPSLPPDDPRTPQFARVQDSTAYLAYHLHEVPVMVVPLVRQSAGRVLSHTEQVSI